MYFEAKDAIKSILTSTLKPILKEHGYLKKAYNWRKFDGPVIKVVNVQHTQWSFPHDTSFTVNLGVYHEEFHRESGRPEPSKNVLEVDCDVRHRIGEFMDGDDYWWRITPDVDIEKTRLHLQESLTNRALPWLEGFDGLNDIYKHFAGMKWAFEAAVAAQLLGRPDVEKWARKAIRQANDYWTPIVRDWAKRHGIDIG